MIENYSRVTEILYPFSGLSNADPEVLMAAADRGTRAHKACEAIAAGLGEFGVDPEIMGFVESFKKWWGTGKKVVAMEERFFCDEHELTGQCDFIIETPEGLAIVDLKTSRHESKTWRVQGAAYAYLARKKGYDIKRILFVHLNIDGDEPKVFEYEEDWDFFLACLTVYNYFFKPAKKRKSRSSEKSKESAVKN